jgi:hypothetical protein
VKAHRQNSFISPSTKYIVTGTLSLDQWHLFSLSAFASDVLPPETLVFAGEADHYRSAVIWVLLLVAFVACPAAYVACCGRMRGSAVPRPPVVPFFFLFGTLGGWILALALSPSGLTATCIVFLVTAAPLALLASSIYLLRRPDRSLYHRVAIWSGFGYAAVLLLFAALVAIFS